jgi:hypothetical protein
MLSSKGFISESSSDGILFSKDDFSSSYSLKSLELPRPKAFFLSYSAIIIESLKGEELMF